MVDQGVSLGFVGDVFEVMAQVYRRLTKVNTVDRIIRVNDPDRKPGASQVPQGLVDEADAERALWQKCPRCLPQRCPDRGALTPRRQVILALQGGDFLSARFSSSCFFSRLSILCSDSSFHLLVAAHRSCRVGRVKSSPTSPS
jgi:hypothetical protein